MPKGCERLGHAEGELPLTMTSAGGGMLHVKASDENACAIQEGYRDCCAIRESMISAARYRGAALVARTFAFIAFLSCGGELRWNRKRAGYCASSWMARAEKNFGCIYG